MVLHHEESNTANRYDDSAEQAVIEKRQDQGVWNGFMGDVAVFGEGRDQSRTHPIVHNAETPSNVVPLRHWSSKPRGTSYPEVDEPEFRVPTFSEWTPEARAEQHSHINDVREQLRARKIIAAAHQGKSVLTRELALQRVEDERRGR